MQSMTTTCRPGDKIGNGLGNNGTIAILYILCSSRPAIGLFIFHSQIVYDSKIVEISLEWMSEHVLIPAWQLVKNLVTTCDDACLWEVISSLAEENGTLEPFLLRLVKLWTEESQFIQTKLMKVIEIKRKLQGAF